MKKVVSREHPRKTFFKLLRKHWLGILFIVICVFILGLARWLTLPREGRHFWPVSADDWVAWGTWTGAAGAVGAVIFAASSVRQAIAAQEDHREDLELDREQRNQDRESDKIEREAERRSDFEVRQDQRNADRKIDEELRKRNESEREKTRKDDREARDLDRESDRRERAAERKADYDLRQTERKEDREAQEVLKRNEDEAARQMALHLSWSVSPYRPYDPGYSDLEYDRHKQIVSQSHSPHEVEHDDGQTMSIHVLISNNSAAASFSELTLHLVEDGVKASVVGQWRRDTLPPWDGISDRGSGYPPDWISTPANEQAPIYPPGTNRWMVGTIAPKKQLLVKLEFDRPQDRYDWEGLISGDPRFRNDNGGHVIFTYRDANGAYWIRSTRDDYNTAFRKWEFSI